MSSAVLYRRWRPVVKILKWEEDSFAIGKHKTGEEHRARKIYGQHL